MLKVFTSDCAGKVRNVFELVVLASKRANDLDSGATPTIRGGAHKSAVTAMLEIANESISINDLRASTVKYLKHGRVSGMDNNANGETYVDLNAIREDTESDIDEYDKNASDYNVNFDLENNFI